MGALDTVLAQREMHVRLFKLGHQFVNEAKTYGKIIITELGKPDHLRTIRPSNMKGIAGGARVLYLSALLASHHAVKVKNTFAKGSSSSLRATLC